MNNRLLGKSSLRVSELGLGCMSLTGKDKSADLRCIQRAFDAGINYFDTADFYGFGENERLVGKAVSSFRSEIVIATKVGNRWNKDRENKTWDVSRDYIMQALDDSLQRLQTDYIDLYQIHGGTIDDNFEEVIDTLERLVEVGKIRHFGISSMRPNVFSYYAAQTNIVSNMIQYSMLDTRPEEFIDLFVENNVSLIARGTLAQGILIDKEATIYLDHNESVIKEIQNYVVTLAQRYNVSKQSIILNYVLKNKAVASALVGVRTSEQLHAINRAYGQLDSLPTAIFDDFVWPKNVYQEHRL